MITEDKVAKFIGNKQLASLKFADKLFLWKIYIKNSKHLHSNANF